MTLEPARTFRLVVLLVLLTVCPALAQVDGDAAPDNTDRDKDGWTTEEGDCNDRDSQIHPGAAERCNGDDDDCDGATDEGNPGGGEECSTGMSGACAAGTRTCQGGELRCIATSSGSPETCNGLDDDCDGQRDDGNPGGGGSCSTGLEGACGAGTLACSGGELTCSGTQQPEAERCNGVDDDCDGATDEADPAAGEACSTGIPGSCSTGTRVCEQGQLICEPLQQPGAELCANGTDDDCDGRVDGQDPNCEGSCVGRLDEDRDRDGQPDCADNCPATSNPPQADFDGDGFGDACETGALLADVDLSHRVDGMDLAALGRSFGGRCQDETFDRRADLDRDCQIDGTDLSLLAASFGDTAP